LSLSISATILLRRPTVEMFKDFFSMRVLGLRLSLAACDEKCPDA